MDIHAVIFDFFGVICSEISPLWFGKYFSKEEAVRLKDLYAMPVDLGEMSEKDFFGHLSLLVNKSPYDIEVEFKNLIELDSEMLVLIQNLKKNYKLGLCSNIPSNFIRSILDEYNLVGLFDEIVISSECGIVKPDKEIFDLILDKLSVNPGKAIFVDDNPKNVFAAKSFGIESILFVDSQILCSKLLELNMIVE